jgi:hypothetical protein
MRAAGLSVEQQKGITVLRQRHCRRGDLADLVVEEMAVIELQAGQALDPGAYRTTRDRLEGDQPAPVSVAEFWQAIPGKRQRRPRALTPPG